MDVPLFNKEKSSHDSLEDGNDLTNNNINQKWQQFQFRENKIIGSESNTTTTKTSEENACIFCLESNKLIQFCSCNVMAHKTCAIEYISYPGSLNDKCCMCRQKLEYRVLDENTPMQIKYTIILTAIIVLELLASAVSLYLHFIFIPNNDKNVIVYMCALSNLSMFYPLLITLAIGFVIDYNSPRGRIPDAICYCTHEDIPFISNCNWGEERSFGSPVIVLCYFLLIITCFFMTGIIFISVGVFKFYRSFKLKSKKDICFQHEIPVCGV
ncbi:unnamed protein product [Meganyctiphanes norvegica]|uniref:RING-CH-type domain-containing protein n=1 Tax=Meganyctiphanes norvegica TaxID=48144 RepID=A0AAV2R538_MEGNR